MVDYMSTTVDTTTLADDLCITNIIRADKQRFVVWRHNLCAPMADVLPKVIEATLVNPDPKSEYFPKIGQYRYAEDVLDAVLAPGRSHGMMVIVNSFAGNNSDVANLSAMVKSKFPNLPVLELASEVVRDAKREQAFKQKLQALEVAKQNYVIFATSVVEMGITFGTIDFVATMDSGYQNETIGDVTFPVEAPLGVNSLLQRFGRTGRKRPGIAYNSCEVDADYSGFDDVEFNNPNVLKYEPLHYPMTSAPLMALAYYACGQEWEYLEDWVADLQLPSRIEDDAERMQHLTSQIDILEELGMVEDTHLTDFGVRMKRWVGQADLAYATQLQCRFEDGCELPELMFWVVATALSNVPLVTLRENNGYFVDFEHNRNNAPHVIHLWQNCQHEDIAIFKALCLATYALPDSLFAENAGNWDYSDAERWCIATGVKRRAIFATGKSVANTWKLFCKINAQTTEFAALVDKYDPNNLNSLPWASFLRNLPEQDIYDQLLQLLSVEDVQISGGYNGQFDWSAAQKSGQISQDDTPIKLDASNDYVGRLIPNRKSIGDEATWQLAHIGILQAYEPEIEPEHKPSVPIILDRYADGTARHEQCESDCPRHEYCAVDDPTLYEYCAADDEIELFLRWLKRKAIPYVKSKLFRRK